MTRVYWWNGQNNYGDALTPVLLKHFAGIEAKHVAPHEAELIVTGSIIGDMPLDWKGIVLGAGKMVASPDALSMADVRALRGPLTGSAPVYADPGLLAALLPHPKVVTTGHTVGVIPHYVDSWLADRWAATYSTKGSTLLIDITQHPIDIITQASMCQEIVSSSLHGLILADSLGLPRRWEPCSEVLGDGFKFRDYGASVGWGAEPNAWWQIDPDVLNEKQAQLLFELERLKP
jgi:hypothetical protein